MKLLTTFALLLVCLICWAVMAAEGTPAVNDNDAEETPEPLENDDDFHLYPPYPQPLKFPEVSWWTDAFGTPAAQVTGVTATEEFLYFSLRCEGEYVRSRNVKSYLKGKFPKDHAPTFYFSQSATRTFKDGDEELMVELRSDYWLGSYALKVRYVKNGTSRVAWVSPILADTLQRVNRKLQDELKKRPVFARHGDMLAVEWRDDNPPVSKLDAFPEDAAPWDWLHPLLPKIAFINLFNGSFDLKFRVAEHFMRQIPASEIAADGMLAMTTGPGTMFHHGAYKMPFAFVSSNELPLYIRWSFREIFGDAFPERHVGYAEGYIGGPDFDPPYKTEYLCCTNRDSLFLRLQEGEAAKLRQAAKKGIVRVQEFPQGCFIRFADTVFWYDPRLKSGDPRRLCRIERRRFTGGTDELLTTYGPWLRQQNNAAVVADEATWARDIACDAERYAAVAAGTCNAADERGGDLAIVGAAILARVAAGASRAAATGAAFVAAQSKAAGTNGTPEAAATAKAMREAARMALKIAMAAQSHAQARMTATR